MSHDAENHLFKLAEDFVNNTGRNIFLTGKAGTGKTTFLKHIQATTNKRSVVVAPTGVAAINAGGVTMHSFFQLPLGPFLPVGHKGFSAENAGTDINSLFRNMRINTNRKKIFRELELLIIDEVSMVRADALDAIDTILRHFRRQPLTPFGGVQVLFIGDMFQLPPVIKDEEWQLLSQYYNGPFFFDAQVLQQAPPLYIELKKIYRQNELQFIDILNRIRNNETTTADLQVLNAKLDTEFHPGADGKYITLCTHNFKADQINKLELERLPHKSFSFKGELTGEFNEKALPAELTLQLKEGAQVMFIKNDKGEDRRFYNGKLASVSKISPEQIEVELADSGETVVLEKETWRNIRYRLNEASNEIEEEELGSFSQYPVRLAWAITIHKSQGLTFEKAIIDAGQSFAAGQVYVALSRCTSLEGLVLYSRIVPQSINTDHRVIEFAKREAAFDRLAEILVTERKAFEASRIKHVFDWNKLTDAILQWQEELPRKKIEDKAGAMAVADAMAEKVNQQQETAIKFQRQLSLIIQRIDEPGQLELLIERMKKAVAHFTQAIHIELIVPLTAHMEAIAKQKKVKQYRKDLELLEELCWHKLQQVWQAEYNDHVFNEGLQPFTKKAKSIPVSMPTRLITLQQYHAGETLEEIALSRNLANSTIESHLAECIGNGELELETVLPSQTIDRILQVVLQPGNLSLSDIKTALNNDFSFGEIRMVVNHVRFTNQSIAEGSK